MGTGIVSVALLLDHRDLLGTVLLAAAAAVWLGLVVSILLRARGDPARLRSEAGSPLALTAPAATAVLAAGAVELEWSLPSATLLALAAALWAGLLAPVLARWHPPTTGRHLLPAVSTEALAVVAAPLAARLHAPWLLDVALGWCLLGLALYMLAIAAFDPRQLAVARGDHWITGGALAISTLAAARLVTATGRLHPRAGLGALEAAVLLLWLLTIACVLALLVAEGRYRRPHYHPERWATVFPVGMCAACSFAAGAVLRAGALTWFAQIWVWVAAGLWALILAATIEHRARPARAMPQRDGFHGRRDRRAGRGRRTARRGHGERHAQPRTRRRGSAHSAHGRYPRRSRHRHF